MTDFPFAIVGFDLDGTLLDTSGDLTAAVNHALAAAGRPLLTVKQVRPMIGGGARHMLAQGMAATGGCEPEELSRLHKLLLSYYEVHVAVESRPFPGAIASLDALAAMGVRLGIVTNKFEHLAEKLLRALDLRDRFDVVIGGDTMGLGRSKPAPDGVLAMTARCGGGRVAFVGDSIYDIEAAKRAGVANVAVSFGFLMQPVEELGADRVIDHYDALIPALRTLA